MKHVRTIAFESVSGATAFGRFFVIGESNVDHVEVRANTRGKTEKVVPLDTGILFAYFAVAQPTYGILDNPCISRSIGFVRPRCLYCLVLAGAQTARLGDSLD